MPRSLDVGDRQSADDQAHDRHQQQHPPLDMRAQEQAEPVDRRAHDGRGDPDDQGPAEFGDVRAREMGQPGHRQGERAEPGQCVEAEKNEGTHAGGEQARQQHEPQHGTADAGGLHQQERTREGRAEERADGGEAAGRGDHGHGLGWHVVAPGQPHGEHGEPAAERDQRRLRPQHDTEGQGGQGREQHAGKLGGRGRAATRLEPVRRRVTAPARKVLNDRRDRQAGHHQDGNRPPRRRTVKAEPVGEMGEDLALQVGDQHKEPVGRGRDGRAKHRCQDQQSQVGLAPQQLLRVLGRRHDDHRGR